MKKYDVIVIGSGVAGISAAYGLKEAGKNVLIIEENLWGGTCPNRGCDPKKVLLSGVEARDRVNQLAGKGFKEMPPADWKELQAFKRTFTDPVPEERKEGLANAGIDFLTGTARFIDEKTIEILGEHIMGDYFVIATGQRPSLLPIEGKEYMQTSTDFLSLDQLPDKVVFIGGGYIAFELASIANGAGADVTIIHHNSRPLKAFDADLVDEAVEEMKKRGIRFAFDTDLKKIEKTEEGYHLTAENFDETVGAVFCATGRIPNIESLDLEKANVQADKHGISVNEYLQTSNPAIFACGDIISRRIPKLTPVATFEGNHVVQNIAAENMTPIEYPSIPTIVYASPKIASVGVTPAEAEKQGLKVVAQDLTSWFSYSRLNEPTAKVKLVYNEENLLVGACTLSGQADELINFLSIAIDKKISHDEISRYIMGYPTIASDLGYLL